MEGRKPTARWGEACAHCSAAKAKCIRSNDTPGAKCDRCERLSRDCAKQVHRPRKKRAVKPSRTAQLEERLNGLVELLSASKAARDASNTEAIPTSSRRHTSYDVSVSSGSSSPESITDPGDIEDDAEPLQPRNPILQSSEHDETLLYLYQIRISPLFPFVIIPPGIPYYDVRQQRPFLFACIRMVSSLNDTQTMRPQIRLILSYIAEHALVQSDKSLDLLQGILIVLGWYHHHCLAHAQMNNLTCLATSLVADLGLNRRPPPPELKGFSFSHCKVQETAASNEEKRALLAAWYLSSLVALGYEEIDSMIFSPYMKQCLVDLEEEQEYGTDVNLVRMVRLQQLSEEMANLRGQEGEPDFLNDSSNLRMEADKLAFSVSKSASSRNSYLELYVLNTNLHRYEPPVIDDSLLTRSQSWSQLQPGEVYTALDDLYQSRHALVAWWDYWFTIPITSSYHLPLSVVFQIIYAVSMLLRWEQLVSSERKDEAELTRSGRRRDPAAVWLSQKEWFEFVNTDSTSDISHQNPATHSALGQRSTLMTPDTVEPQQTRPGHGEWRPTRQDYPEVPVAVQTLRSHLKSQPGLPIDSSGILARMIKLCRQASDEIGDSHSDNFWAVAASKFAHVRDTLDGNVGDGSDRGLPNQGPNSAVPRPSNVHEHLGGELSTETERPVAGEDLEPAMKDITMGSHLCSSCHGQGSAAAMGGTPGLQPGTGASWAVTGPGPYEAPPSLADQTNTLGLWNMII
ncbi:hypothetical protein GE09DRAFT_559672 [Coniochaeta sp. 2T2.1]|nr:hypothetical protein GE09DRAFT_559672 [Coniochaeta sp. 2T2.1]